MQRWARIGMVKEDARIETGALQQSKTEFEKRKDRHTHPHSCQRVFRGSAVTVRFPSWLQACHARRYHG